MSRRRSVEKSTPLPSISTVTLDEAWFGDESDLQTSSVDIERAEQFCEVIRGLQDCIY